MRNSARILIVTNGHLCRNPRVLKEANTLGEAGYDVTVLSVRNNVASESVDAKIIRHAPFRRTTVDMLPGFAKDTAVTIWQRRLRLWLNRHASRHLRLSTIESLGPASVLLRRASSCGADLTIVHNEAPHWVGTRLIASGRRVAADIEDWHSEDLLSADRAGRPIEMLRNVERTLLHQAVYTTTTAHAMAEAMHARYGGRRPDVLTNAFPLQPLSARDHTDWPTFFWFSQTIGPGRGLESFFCAWSLTRHQSRLVLLGETRGEYAANLVARLSAQRCAQVAFLSLVAPAKLPGVIARHDIGLALEPSEPRNKDLTISNKILQYCNAGLAVVASDTAGQREVLAHDPAAGLIVDTNDTAAFAATLDRLLDDRTILAARQRAARRLAERVYSWEREAPKLLALVERALRSPIGKVLS